jgi:uncharacterized protein
MIGAAWIGLEADSRETLELSVTPDGIAAAGQVDLEGGQLHYRIDCAPDWSTRRLSLRFGDQPPRVILGDGTGAWRSSEGEALDLIAGCIDVDISATPFTNTLPIRRLKLAAGEQASVDVVYIAAPSLDLRREIQAYTCLVPGQRYRFESRDGFEAVLEVDEHGLVLDYPGLFRRVG